MAYNWACNWQTVPYGSRHKAACDQQRGMGFDKGQTPPLSDHTKLDKCTLAEHIHEGQHLNMGRSGSTDNMAETDGPVQKALNVYA